MMQRNVKRIVSMLLLIIMMLSSTDILRVYANEEGEYTIIECLNPESTMIAIDEENLEFEIVLDGKRITGEGLLYKLEGAALYLNTMLVDISASSDSILFCSLEKNDRKAFEFVCVIKNDLTREIYVVKTVINENEAGKAMESFNNIKAITLDNPLYEELMLTGRWETLYIEANRKNIGKIKWTEYYTTDEDVSTYGLRSSSDLSVMQGYGIPLEAFTDPYFVMGYKRDSTSKEVVGFYIRDTYEMYEGTYVSCVALYDITANVANDMVTFAVTRANNYFVEAVEGETPKVTEAPADSTYIITKNPNIGVRLGGYGTKGSFDNVQFTISLGGLSMKTSCLTDAAIELIGSKCEELAVPLDIIGFFGEGLEMLRDWKYNKKIKKFTFVNDEGEYLKGIATSQFEEFLYMKHSLLKITAPIKNFSTLATSKMIYEYNTEIVGSNYHNSNDTFSVYVNFEERISD